LGSSSISSRVVAVGGVGEVVVGEERRLAVEVGVVGEERRVVVEVGVVGEESSTSSTSRSSRSRSRSSRPKIMKF